MPDDIVTVTRAFTVEMAEEAYRNGLFPMYVPAFGVYTWHKPDPRAIIPLDRFHVSRSLKKTLRSGTFELTYDRDFAGVMKGCAEGRPVWIGKKFFEVYGELHKQGKAHSVEVWQGGKLVGGTYGVQLGAVFCAESKFHRVTDASKAALAGLVERLRERGFQILEVQYVTPHLKQFGTVEIPWKEYMRRATSAMKLDCRFA
ncbi:MAG: leucyl/phenylalanyl-tRNA--protein transferase [Planctomycetes bacterium]|nr:leucyl/phenylalanyl-tRNA--protein transferase [Planctomycetota bacterium]